MKNSIFFSLIFLTIFTGLTAQTVTEKYRRSSLHSILIQHPEKKFCEEIVQIFDSIPFPDKFDNHELELKVIDPVTKKTKKKKNDEQRDSVEVFLTEQTVAKQLVAKWFNRDMETGTFNIDLLRERGIYDASLLDIELAENSARGSAMLADAGEELIGNTFVLVNDIHYIDKEERAKLVGSIFGAVSEVSGAFGGDIAKIVSASADLGNVISDQIAGFRVTVTSYLFRLIWDDETSTSFYEQYYIDEESLDPEKKNAFDEEKGLFRLVYVGAQTVDSGTTTLKGVSTKEDMIKKVCTRAIDAAIVRLQRNHDEFKVKTPLTQVDPLVAAIGVKEGVDEKTKFEVLERIIDADGKTKYKRAGVIQPVKGKIWDNRYLAAEEEFEGANLTATEFKKVSGGNFYPGMLIREIK